LFAFKNPLKNFAEVQNELKVLGLTIEDWKANKDLIFEMGIFITLPTSGWISQVGENVRQNSVDRITA